MKKFCSIIVLLVLLGACMSASAEKDILFRNIPWDSNVSTAKSLWGVEGYSSEVENVFLGYEENYMDVYPSLNQTKVQAGHTVLAYVSGLQVAGYNASNITMYFRYGDDGDIKDLNNAQFCAASYSFDNIVDIAGAHDDLREKLSSLYGIPNDTSKDTGGTQWGTDGTQEYKAVKRISVWEDSLGAKVFLISMTSDNKNAVLTNYLYMVYLEPDYDNRLTHTELIATRYAVQQENENRSTSVDGL